MPELCVRAQLTMGRKVCRTPGCPTIIDSNTYRGLCPPCARARDKTRGTRAQRGYDTTYDRERRDYKHRIEAGETILCWRCGQPVDTDFHLGHSDDRTHTKGPEHPTCNLKAAGKASHP